jgi:hypothetical protein
MADRPARVFNANEFKHVKIVDDFESGKNKGNPRVECLYCLLQFVGQATRRREHLAGTSGFGVAVCSEVPAEIKQENIRVTQEKTREREAKGKKHKVAASAAVVCGAVVYGQCRIRPHSQPLHWLYGCMPA